MPSSRSIYRRRRRRARKLLIATVIGATGGLMAGVAFHDADRASGPLAALRSPATASPLASDRFGIRDKRLGNDSDALREARELLPETFAQYATRRFIVLSDASPKWTKQQAQLLDRTYHQFQRFTKRIGMKPRPLRHKLVCVLFHEYEDYREFARTQDNVTADWISGYYSPRADRIVFYNIETNPEFARAAQPGEAPEVLASAAPAHDGHVACGCAVTARGRMEEEYRKAAIATVVHEAVHQLSFHTRLQTPHLQNPLWLSEGLATAFETDNPRGSFGPEHDYRLRERMFRELMDEGKLIPLAELVSYSRMPNNDDDTISAVYHQSYALMRWMARFQKAELEDFFTRLLNETPGRPTPQRHLQMFEQSFGDVDRLERVWLRHEAERK